MSSRVSSPDSILSEEADKDSIFGDDSSQADSLLEDEDVDQSHPPAVTDCPPVRGLYIFPGLLDEVLAGECLYYCLLEETEGAQKTHLMRSSSTIHSQRRGIKQCSSLDLLPILPLFRPISRTSKSTSRTNCKTSYPSTSIPQLSIRNHLLLDK